MEEHRLKSMPEDYNPVLFNYLYKKTRGLRNKLSREIDARRFGVEPKDIQSWFDIKFIHAYTKYLGKEPEILKAYIIRSLMFFKNKLLRYSYYHKNSIQVNSINIEDLYKFDEIHVQYEETGKEFFMDLALSFLKDRLSHEAYNLLLVELNPPLYILNELAKDNKAKTPSKIPSTLIAEFFGWGINGINHVNALRREIRKNLAIARRHFASQGI